MLRHALPTTSTKLLLTFGALAGLLGFADGPGMAEEQAGKTGNPGAGIVTVPDEAAMAALIATAPTGHPRLFASRADLDAAKARSATDPVAKALLAAVLDQADAGLGKPALERVLEGRRLLGVSRGALRRLSSLGMAWQMTGDAKYATRGVQELLAICRFSDWHPDHFLDVAEMTLAAAIGYDWLYAALDDATRAEVRQAIITKGIEPSFVGNMAWIKGTNNWTQVCHGGLVAGALVIQDQDPALAARTVRRALTYLPVIMHTSYAPDGAYPEGPGYWEYGTSYNVVAIEALRSVLGRDFGLSRMPGFLATADYLAHAHGPTLLPFCYSDCGIGPLSLTAAQVWFGRENHTGVNQPNDADKTRIVQDRLLALGLLWADRAPGDAPKPRPLDYLGRSAKPVAMFRSAWNDPQALYLGVCGGTPTSSHGHMDEGSFVFDAAGVRWGQDLGMQSYNSLETKGVDLWNFKQDSQRWTVLRLNNHAHSTLVLGGKLQEVRGFAPISAFNPDPVNPGCTVDLTAVYAGQAAQVERQFTLPERQRLEVRDHIAGLTAAGTVRWQMVTRAAVAIAADRRHATLTQDGKTLSLAVESPAEATLVVSDATPRQSYDAENPDTRIIAAEVNAAAGATIDYHVVLVPERR